LIGVQNVAFAAAGGRYYDFGELPAPWGQQR
jgi:hypothetical protein